MAATEIGALIVVLAIRFLLGNGGHVPAFGLAAGGPSSPSVLAGVILAGLAPPSRPQHQRFDKAQRRSPLTPIG